MTTPFGLVGNVKFALVLENGDEQIPVGPGTIRKLSIIENKNSLLPTCDLSFEDVTDSVAKALLADGTKIKVYMSPDTGTSEPPYYTFRVFDVSNISNTIIGRHVEISGIADSPGYFRNIQTKSKKGTSSEVASEIANKFGFKSDIDKTNDKMTWLPNNLPYGQWLTHVIDHAYKDDKSHMQLAVTDMGGGKWTLRVKNITEQAKKSGVATIASIGFEKQGDIPITHYNISSQSGFNNNTYGYNSSVGQQNISGDMKENKTIIVDAASKFLDMNSIVKGIVELGFREWLPPSTGNTHDNWAKAKNQNRRLASTFNVTLEVLVMDYTTFGLLDPIEVKLANLEGNALDQAYSGKYILTARTRHVQGTRYCEKLVLDAQGLNLGGNGELVGGTSGADFGGFIPEITTNIVPNKGEVTSPITPDTIKNTIKNISQPAYDSMSSDTLNSIINDVMSGFHLSQSSMSSMVNDFTEESLPNMVSISTNITNTLNSLVDSYK